ncbi:MAG TPA: NAD(+) diphosphatase [Myxococcales bacterium]|nr:NAD(+) diphosphatase [Myxococcales bacterium]
MFAPTISTTQTEGRLFVVKGLALCVVRDERGLRAPMGPAGDAIVIGTLDGQACFARGLAEGETPAGTELVSLRQLFGGLSDDEFGVAGRALGLVAWDRDHRFCGRCGAPTERSATERMRVCTRCGFHAYPRLSPAVICLVERDGKVLLARNARANMPFFSVLAGFVEVGETLEQCVAREIREEAGIEVKEIHYFGSQPWPFTNSLMIGFTAQWAAGELNPDDGEIAEPGWFEPGKLPTVPPKLSIARELIDDFVKRHA